MAHLVVLLPGVMGSCLKLNDSLIWDPPYVIQPGVLALDPGVFKRGASGDGIVATSLLQRPMVIERFVRNSGYQTFIQGISKGIRADVCPGNDFNSKYRLHTFPYDWRLSVAHIAEKLYQEVDRMVDERRRRSGNFSEGAILIGHSMGGLIASYAARCLDEKSKIKAVVTIGTPMRGSLDALAYLTGGFRLLLRDLGSQLKTMPGVYDLTPTYACVDTPGGYQTPWAAAGTGISNAHLLGRRDLAQQMTDSTLEPPAMRCYIGTGQGTAQSMRFQDDTHSWRTDEEHPAVVTEKGFLQGDGTVPMYSALHDVPATYVFVNDSHACLHNNAWLVHDVCQFVRYFDAPHTFPLLAPPPETDIDKCRLDLPPISSGGGVLAQATAGFRMQAQAVLLSLTRPEARHTKQLHLAAGETAEIRYQELPPDIYMLELLHHDTQARVVSDITQVTS
ncbi:MAG: lipase family alpha/beta hydrolase [Prosthecobacter sp.]